MNKPEELVNKIIESLDENKGHQIVKIDLRKIENCFCSFFVICHGTSNTHVSALADGVEDKVQEDLHEKPFHTEGREQAQWIIVDYGDVIVHVFQKEQRDYYQLEDFWGDGIKEEINNSEQ
ncbi:MULTISPECIES: ribosome silencing factor [Culturomica]|jgi:ribosome-associated protein|uniref:ribosome silencing factor n=1 Tax=Culturomica TaxID=1926651 RepID=UPI000336635A|nr:MULTISPECIES: ribosome silencing factor [Odoribacteraceae]RHV94038.1 ribosome silencing factor [Odoribacter sp. OF09-27XD]CCZ06054.1 iojap-like ribosome-associated protein [Odoribacter sp. CAG:788]HBO26098.1 ribosome silencing factor [Culturomica sp.]